MIELDAAAGCILLVTSQATPGLGTRIRGAKFKRQPQPHWTLPLNMTACREARHEFGRNLEIGPELTVWAKVEVDRERLMEHLGKASDAELRRLPEVSPVLATAMERRTYQRVAARFVAEGQRVLIADEPGLGKTLEAIGGIIESGVPGPYLVLAPKTATHVVWGREIPRWYPGAEVVLVPDGRAARDQILDELLWHPKVYDGQPMVDTERLQDEYYTSQANTWVVVHPEMMRAKRWWVCPACGDKTRWRAGRIQLDCVLGYTDDGEPHPYVNTKDVRKETEYTFPQLFQIEWGAIVSDECDKMLVRKTGTPNQTRTGAEDLRTRPNGVRIAMSGTPTRGKPQLLWGTLNWLQPERYTSYWRWVEQYWDVSKGWGDSRNIGALTGEGAARLDAELKQMMLRRTKAEVAPDMPPKNYIGTTIYAAEDEHYGRTPAFRAENGSDLAVDERDAIAVWLPMEGEQKRLYEEMERSGLVEMEGGRLDPLGILAEHTRMKQFATSAGVLRQELRDGEMQDVFYPRLPSNKFEHLMEAMEQMGFPDDPQDKVIVTSQYTSLLDMFRDEMCRRWEKEWSKRRSPMVCSVTGKVTGRARESVIDQFNLDPGTDSPHVMFLNVKAGGVAITIDSADHMFGIDETWNPDDEIQVEDRIHRVSKPRPVFYHKLRSLGTIEARIAKVNAEMAADARYVLDGRRGVEYHRMIRGTG
jgi:hypothetical protein